MTPDELIAGGLLQVAAIYRIYVARSQLAGCWHLFDAQQAAVRLGRIDDEEIFDLPDEDAIAKFIIQRFEDVRGDMWHLEQLAEESRRGG